MTESVSVLGSTGSIGRQTVEVCGHLGIAVRALAAKSNTSLLEEQARRLRPSFVAVFEEDAAEKLRYALAGTGIKVGSGKSGLMEAATIEGTGCVVTGLCGSVGLEPTLAAIGLGRRIALANKETLVSAGALVMESAKKSGAEIIPVDSEHSAIFQCLAGREIRRELKRIILTASGGPFRGWTLERTASVTPGQAVSHPNWSMGRKISVDSATMMNKGLELIEAMHLFGVGPEDIRILIHPQSVIHSMVELRDGSVIAEMGTADMRLPIQYALTYPERRPSPSAPLDFLSLGALTFEEPDLRNLPCLALAIDCAKRGGTAPAALSAANEEAVELFLGGKTGFNGIYECVKRALDSISIIETPELNDILAADKEARSLVRAAVRGGGAERAP